MRRVRASLQNRVETVSDDETLITYTTVDTLSMSVTTSGGREFTAAKKLQPELTHQAECRYDARIKPKMRLMFDGVVLDIRAVYDPTHRGRQMLLMCAEVVQ